MNTEFDQKLKRTAAISLLICAVVSIVFMVHHPYTAAETLPERLAEIKNESALSAWVHGVLIVVMLGLTYGIYGVKVHLGSRRPLSVLAFIFYVYGIMAYALAATVSGFVAPEIGIIFAETSIEEMQLARRFLQLAWVSNQGLSYMGLMATSAGIFCWSVLLVLQTGRARMVGVIGLIAGVLPVLMWVFGDLRLNVTGMHFVVVVDAVWYVAVAIELFTGRKTSP